MSLFILHSIILLLYFCCIEASYRSPQHVKAKIEHIIGTYKNAVEQVHQSGNGLEGDQHSSFMDMIHQRYCKYYSVLDPILGERPNVFAAWTNENNSSDAYSEEDKDSSGDDEESQTADDDFIELSGDSEDDTNSNEKSTSGAELDMSDLTSSDVGTSLTTTPRKICGDVNTNLESSQRENRNSIESPKKKKRIDHNNNVDDKSTSSYKSKSLSVMEANKKRKDKKKTILGKKGRSTTLDDNTDPMISIIQSQAQRVSLQQSMHRDNMKLQKSRLNLETLKLRREDNLAALQEEKLRGEILSDVTAHNFETLKKRMEMKEKHPNLTDSYLDSILPFRKVPDEADV